MNLSNKLPFLFIFILGLIIIQSCQDPGISPNRELKLKGITPEVPGNPTPLFKLYAIRNNTLYGIDHTSGGVTPIGAQGFWTGATAMTVVYLPCGNGQYTINIMKGNALYAVNPQTGFTQKVGSASILGPTRFMFGYYVTRMLTSSQMFYNLGCTFSPRIIGGRSWTNIVATATVSHANDEVATSVETNYFVQNGSLYSLQSTTAVLAGAENAWSGTEAMASIDDQLYIAQLSALHRFNTTTGIETTISSANDDWSGIKALGSADGFLYAVKSGTMYRINALDGTAIQLGAAGDWTGTVALANLPPRLVFP